MSNRFISVDIDTTLDPELIKEGLAREVVNRIQKSRKDLNFNVGDRIEVTYFGSPEVVEAIKAHEAHIASETLATKVSAASAEQSLKYEIDEYNLSLSLKKV